MGLVRQRAATATWTGSGGAPWRDDDDRPTLRWSGPRLRSIAGSLPRVLPASSGPVAIAAVPAQLGPYRLLGLLGEGGMARVYAAEHVELGRRVAIKTLLPGLVDHPVARAMLLREARIAGAVRHRNLIAVHDFACDDQGRPYCVMELAAGETLATRLARGPLPVCHCLDVAIEVADALAAVHAAGYLHRDIKSENVLLTRDGRRLHAKLIDFGIARAIVPDPDDDVEGMVGTPSTMAPEQIAQEPIDERTDLWALGVLIHEMATAELPFPAHATVRDDLVAIVTEAPLPFPAELGPELSAVVEACLAKDPADRPPSAQALVDRLRAARVEYRARHALSDRLL